VTQLLPPILLEYVLVIVFCGTVPSDLSLPWRPRYGVRLQNPVSPAS